ncbi:MAG TPA: protein kinase, partial [Terriglobales bacterium]|nr:protein kinase [Terriglobales bacterium]
MAEFQAHAKAPVPASDPLVGSLIGRFFIRQPLGSGGMGEVYLADDTKLKRSVAVKRIAPELNSDASYRLRFLKEAERASGVTGAHIAAIYDVLESDGQIFLIMEYVDGENLRQRMRQPISLEQFLALATQCAEALVSAHARGVIHCDLKPENIMVTSRGDVKVLDFGVAKHLPRSDQSSTMDKAQSLGGTPAYMAPEVLLEKSFDERADIFSLGVVFYEVLTGQHPFRTATFVETSHRIVHEQPKPLRNFNREVPAALQTIVSRMLAKDPAARFASASELLADLRKLQHASTTLRPVIAHPWRARTIWAVLALAIVLAFLAAPALKRSLHLTPVPVEKHLAVLRFVSSGTDPNERAFTDGLTETLTIKLAQLTDKYPLQVVPPSEIRNENVTTVDQARREFGVNLVLEGSLAQSGNTVRINYALVDATRLRQLRGDVITAQAGDPFAVEDKVVDSVIKDLDLELQGKDRQALVARQTNAPAAFDYYLRGRGYLQDPKPENLDNAVAVFSHALDQDPNFSLAYAGLGEAYWQKYEHTNDGAWVQKARQACERAATLGSELAATHTCLGTVFDGTGKYEEAVLQFRRATELDPTSDDAVRGLGSAYEHLGKLADAEAAYRHAIELRPQSWMSYNMLG